MTTDYNPYVIIDDVTMAKVMDLLNTGRTMAEKSYPHASRAVRTNQRQRKRTMGDEETMKMLMGENLRIMVGGQVVGMAKEAKFSIAEDEASTEEFSDPWRTPDIKQSWDISCGAMVRDAGDVLHDLLNGKEKWDVTIGQEVGKLPRKMKKAIHSKRMSKWKHKVAAYINRRQIRIHDAEMVVTPDQFDTLKATISGGTIEHGCVVSGKQISEALERYKHRRS